MPNKLFDDHTQSLLEKLNKSGELKHFYELTGPMGPVVQTTEQNDLLTLCSNNYLGLADHPEVIDAGIQGLRDYGAGTASVRFICGTLKCHRELESTIAAFVGTQNALTYVSCWNANEALIPTVVDPEDIVLSDELNHASIIDGCRLIRQAKKSVYKHSDMEDLERQLKANMDRQCRWVITDGVFSMEGDVARLNEIHALCTQYEAQLILDDSHGIGVLGTTGRGTPEYFDLLGKIDILTGTLGKSLGGAAGGYVAAASHVVELLEQRSRPSLFSNALPATVAYSARKAIEIIHNEPQRIERLHNNVATIRTGLANLGFDCPPSPTAIIPIMIGDTAETYAKSRRLMEMGILVIGFGYPVVPEGTARLRVQVSAALDASHIERILDAFAKL